MSKCKIVLSAVCAGLLSTASLAFPQGAQAEVLRLAPSAFCQPEHDTTDIFTNTTVNRVRRVGGQLRSQWGQNTVVCGFPSGNPLPHQNVNVMKIRGFRGGVGDFTQGLVQACVTKFTGAELCGSSTDFGDGGNFTVFVQDLSAWSHSSWYPYLKIKMQSGDRLYTIAATD